MKVKDYKDYEKRQVNEIYSVEKVLDRKVEKGKEFYYIKWLNYGNSHNSWEPKKNLDPSLIEDYNKENGNRWASFRET